MTAHGSDFLQDELFLRCYAAGKATGSWWTRDREWHAYVVCWAGTYEKAIEGDFVECGVHKSSYPRMLAKYIPLEPFPHNKPYLFHPLTGIPKRHLDSPPA